jgi:hypothetical protein
MNCNPKVYTNPDDEGATQPAMMVVFIILLTRQGIGAHGNCNGGCDDTSA